MLSMRNRPVESDTPCISEPETTTVAPTSGRPRTLSTTIPTTRASWACALVAHSKERPNTARRLSIAGPNIAPMSTTRYALFDACEYRQGIDRAARRAEDEYRPARVRGDQRRVTKSEIPRVH